MVDPPGYDRASMTLESSTAPGVRQFAEEGIAMLLARREEPAPPVTPDADLFEQLGLDSLELAELSVMLEDRFGTDPYSAGLVPRTVGEIVAFYA